MRIESEIRAVPAAAVIKAAIDHCAAREASKTGSAREAAGAHETGSAREIDGVGQGERRRRDG